MWIVLLWYCAGWTFVFGRILGTNFALCRHVEVKETLRKFVTLVNVKSVPKVCPAFFSIQFAQYESIEEIQGH